MKLADRFGDYGLISVVVLELDDDEGRFPLWLMSCRVRWKVSNGATVICISSDRR